MITHEIVKVRVPAPYRSPYPYPSSGQRQPVDHDDLGWDAWNAAHSGTSRHRYPPPAEKMDKLAYAQYIASHPFQKGMLLVSKYSAEQALKVDKPTLIGDTSVYRIVDVQEMHQMVSYTHSVPSKPQCFQLKSFSPNAIPWWTEADSFILMNPALYARLNFKLPE